MKTLFVTTILLCAVGVQAADMTKICMRAYSSASSISCGVFGQADRLRDDGNGKRAIQGFSPDPEYSRTYTLGTKSFGCYSTVYPGNINLTAAKFTCRVTSTNMSTSVKVFLNGVETHFLTMDSGTFVMGR